MHTVYRKSEGRRSGMTFISIFLLILFTSKEIRASDTIEGDIENGKTLATLKCDRCHGEGGVSDDPDTPHLAAQSAVYLLKQLKDYKSKARDDRSMYKHARKLDEQQMADIALWYESQPLPEIKPQRE